MGTTRVQTAVTSLLGLSSVAYPLIAWTTFPFILSIHHKITLVVSGKCQQLIVQFSKPIDRLPSAIGKVTGLVLVFESPWQLTTCHKAFVVSGTHVRFGCRGDQSPSSQQSKQCMGTTDSCFVLVGTQQCSIPNYCLDRISFYTFHSPQDNTCGFRKVSTTDCTIHQTH